MRLAVGQLENFYLHPFTYPPYYLIKDELHRGRVEICTGTGEYETLIVCDDSWQGQDASVVCEELGFSPYGMFIYYKKQHLFFHSPVKCGQSIVYIYLIIMVFRFKTSTYVFAKSFNTFSCLKYCPQAVLLSGTTTSHMCLMATTILHFPGSIGMQSTTFPLSDMTSAYVVDSVNCSGLEDSFRLCPYTQTNLDTNRCSSDNAAEVVCQGKRTSLPSVASTVVVLFFSVLFYF